MVQPILDNCARIQVLFAVANDGWQRVMNELRVTSPPSRLQFAGFGALSAEARKSNCEADTLGDRDGMGWDGVGWDG